MRELLVITESIIKKNILLLQKVRTKSTFTQNVASTFLVQVLSMFLTVATAAIIARLLGPEGNGMLALALLVPHMLGLFLSGGIGVANVYFAGSRRLDVPTLTANSIGFAIIVTILGAGIVSVLSVTGWLKALLPGVPIWLFLLAMFGFPTGLLSGYFSSILQGLQRIITVNIVNLTQSVLTLVLTILLVIGFRLSLLGALLSFLGAGVISLMLIGVFLRREGGVFTPKWDLAVIRSTFFFGMKGHIGNMFQFFNYRLDMFLVNFFIGTASVGIYTVSVAIAEVLWYLPNAVAFVIFPKAAATKPEVMNTFTPRVFYITLGLTLLGGLGLAIMGKCLIQLIFSSVFIGAYVPLLVLLPGVVLLGSTKVLTNEIAGRGYPHYNSINAGLALILTVILDLLLIPRYKAIGAAFASSVAYSVISITAVVFYAIVSRVTTESIVYTDNKNPLFKSNEY